jgi:AcrR family transcriptional regulator
VSRRATERDKRGDASDEATRLAATRGADRPRTRDGRSEVEQQIFAATEELLEDVSLNDLSVGQICDRAGIARGTFYFYFSSKFAVVAGLLAKVMDDIYGSIRPFVDGRADDDPATTLASSLEAGWQVWSSHRKLLRATAEHWASVPELQEMWLGIIERFTDAFAAEIDSERKAGLASEGIDSRVLAAMLLWSTERCAYVAGLGVDEDLPNEQAIFGAMLTIWLRAIYAETPNPARAR